MASKLAETMSKTVIMIHKPFIFFLKTVLALCQQYPRILKAFLCVFFFHFTTLTIGINSFLKFFARVKINKRLKAPRARTIENCAKMIKADWFKNDITHVLVKMVSPLGRMEMSFLLSCFHSRSLYNCISYNKMIFSRNRNAFFQ